MDLRRCCDRGWPGAGADDPGVTGVFRSGGSVSCSSLAEPPGSPLIGGTETTVGTAQAFVRYPVLIPDVPAVRLANLSHTYVVHRTVELIFGRGKVAIEMEPGTSGDSLKDFQRFAAQNRASVAIDRVHGQPALVYLQRRDAAGCRQ